MKTLSDLIQEEHRDRQCGTCARLGTKQGKYGPETYCKLDGKSDSKMICKGALVGRSGGYNMEEKLHEKEKRLLEFIRQLGHGELLIKVADGLPQMIERTTEKVKL